MSEFGNALQIDDIVRCHRLVLQVIQQIAAAGKKCPVAAVTGAELKCLADRARLQQLEGPWFIYRNLPQTHNGYTNFPACFNSS